MQQQQYQLQQPLTELQTDLLILVNDYKYFHFEYVKYDQRLKQYEMCNDIKKDFEKFLDERKSKINVTDYSAKLSVLSKKIYKLCKFHANNKKVEPSKKRELDYDFIKAIGLDFTIQQNSLKTGFYYTFYINNKKMFSIFDECKFYA